MNISSYEHKNICNINQVKYKNLYLINNEFYFLTLKNIELPKILTLGGPEHSNIININQYELHPKVKIFNDQKELDEYVKNLNIIEFNTPTVYFSHYYDHNVGHGLYDALYPIFFAFLNFNNNTYDEFNILVNLLFIPRWKFQWNASRDWLLEIFEKFSKGKLIIRNNIDNLNIYKFSCLISGSEYCGISSVNKDSVMPGKEQLMLEKFRDRFYNCYNIVKPIKQSDKLNILFIDSERFTKEERNTLLNIHNELIQNGHNSNFISWINYPSFKEQLEIMNNTDIHISCSGTSMMNFVFLNDNKIHINLGTSFYGGSLNLPSLMEINIILCSNNICTKLYDIFKYKKIIYEPIKLIIQETIDSIRNCIFHKTIVPNYIQVWREYCKLDPNINTIIQKMNGKIKPDLIAKRWIDYFVYYNHIYKNENLNINLINDLKSKYNIQY